MPIIAPLTYPNDLGRSGQPEQLSGRGKSSVSVRESNLRGRDPVPYQPASNALYYTSVSFEIPIAPCVMICDATSAAIVLTLPLASSCYGRSIDVIKTDTSVNTVTFLATGSDIVSYNAAWVGLNEQWETCRVLALVDSAGQGRWVIMMARSV
jgi:hypothetical protein